MKISVTMTARDLFQFSLYNSYSGFSGAFNVIFTLGALAILAVTWNWETINVYQRILLVFCALIFTVVQPLMLDRKAKQQAGAIGFSAPLNLTLGDAAGRGHRFFRALKPDPGRQKDRRGKGRDDRRAFLEPGMEDSPH